MIATTEATDQKESLNAQVAAAVTPSEQRAVQLLAQVRRTTISKLLREASVNELIRRGERIAERLAELEPDEAATLEEEDHG